MVGRPWTVIAREKMSGNRMSFVFNSEFDMQNAASDFKLRFEQMDLEAMIPGEHKDVYIQPAITTNKRVPKHQMFSGF